MSAVAAKSKTIPVIEIFGPTIQGEGAMAGRVTHFVRIGGCDYRCSWCDSMYAVDPQLVKAGAEYLTPEEIIDRLSGPALDGRAAPWVTLSGGNPAIRDLMPLVAHLQMRDWLVAVETQGSYWRDWLRLVDHLCVSPKPPSSGMATPAHATETARFMSYANEAFRSREVGANCLKIVVFDFADYQWARDFIRQWPAWPVYLSVGTDQPAADVAHLSSTHGKTLWTIADRYRWLCELVASDPAMAHVRVLPQLHVIAWGHAKGV